MGSHKQRVQRKIKKDVKRKAQAHRTQQQRTNNAMSDMMKMMMMLKSDGKQQQSQNQDERIRLIEEAQKAKNEEKKKELQHKEEMKKMEEQRKKDKAASDLRMQQLEEEAAKQKAEYEKQMQDMQIKMEEYKKSRGIEQQSANLSHTRTMNDLTMKGIAVEDDIHDEQRKHEIKQKQHALKRKRQELTETQEDLERDDELAGITGEIKDIQQQITDKKQRIKRKQHEVRMNLEKGNLEALKAENTSLASQLEDLQTRIENTAGFTNEVKAHYDKASTALKAYTVLLKEVEQLVIQGKADETLAQKYNAMNEAKEQAYDELNATVTELRYKNSEWQNQIDIAKQRIKDYRDLEAEEVKLKRENKVMKQQYVNGRNMYEIDDNGDVKVKIDKNANQLNVPDPKDDVDYKNWIEHENQLRTFLGDFPDISWIKLPFDDKYKKSNMYVRLKGRAEAFFSNKSNHFDYNGRKITSINDLNKMFIDIKNEQQNALKKATEKAEKIKEQNKEAIEVKLTPEMINNKELEVEQLKRTNVRLKKGIRQNEADADHYDKLTKEKNKLTSENESLGKIKTEDKTAEIAKLEVEIKNIQEQINEHWNAKADVNKYTRQIQELERKKKALEQELELTPESEISDEQIQKYVNAANDVAKTEANINKRRTKNAAFDKFEADTEELRMQNRVKNQQLYGMRIPGEVNKRMKLINDRVDAEQETKLIEAREAKRNAEEELKIKKFEEEALNSEKVKATRNQIKKEYVDRVINEENARLMDRLINEKRAAKETEATLKAKEMVNKYKEETDGKVDWSAKYAAINAEINDEIKNMDTNQAYVRTWQDEYKSEISKNPQMLPVINEYLNHRKINNITSEDINNLTSRETIDAWQVFKDSFANYKDAESGLYDFDAMDNDEDVNISLKTLFNSSV